MEQGEELSLITRCCWSFDAILFYYQSHGILAKPAHVKRKKFIEELEFFQISDSFDERQAKERLYEEREIEKLEVPSTKRKEFIWKELYFKDASSFRNISYYSYWAVLLLSAVSTTFEPTYGSPTIWLVWETFLGTIYTMEFFLRIYISRNPKNYVISVMGVIDLVSMLSSQTFVFYHFSKAPVTPLVKHVMVFRILKCTRVCRGIGELANVLWVCRDYIVLFVGTALCCCVATASLVQQEEAHLHITEAEPTHAFDFFTWLWYAVITVTGVGYGDYLPHSTLGRIFGGTLSVCGMLLFCLAATQMVHRFVDVYYMPDVLGYTSKGRKREMICNIRDEYLENYTG